MACVHGDTNCPACEIIRLTQENTELRAALASEVKEKPRLLEARTVAQEALLAVTRERDEARGWAVVAEREVKELRASLSGRTVSCGGCEELRKALDEVSRRGNAGLGVAVDMAVERNEMREVLVACWKALGPTPENVVAMSELVPLPCLTVNDAEMAVERILRALSTRIQQPTCEDSKSPAEGMRSQPAPSVNGGAPQPVEKLGQLSASAQQGGERAPEADKGERLYYLLSVKWTKGDLMTWWAPNCQGYVNVLARAGKYTEAQARKQLDPRWERGEGLPDVVAIPCDEVEKHVMGFVPLCNDTRPWMRGDGDGVIATPSSTTPGETAADTEAEGEP